MVPVRLYASRSHTASIFYTLKVASTLGDVNLLIPYPQDFKTYCPLVALNNVTVYSMYWDVNICNRITSALDIANIQNVLLRLWSSKYPEIANTCNCLNVDLFANLTQYYQTPKG